MAQPVLTKTRFGGGVWEGVLAAPGDGPPRLHVSCGGRHVRDAEVTALDPDAGRWTVRVPVPSETLGDGARTFLIHAEGADAALAGFTISAGEAAEVDLRAELDLLRAELDLLKRAFRRHCLEER